MRTAALAALTFAVSLPMLAAEPPKFRRLDSDPQRLPKLLRQIRAAKEAARSCLGTQAITGNRTARSLVIPAAGSVRGAGGEFFRSDVTLTGYVNRLLAIWIGRGATGEPPTFEVAAADPFGYPITYTDFVGQTLGLQNSLGALWFVPVDEEGNFDENGVIDAFSRIWTNQPGRTGTVSQQFQAVDPFSFDFYYDTVAVGLQHNAQYRTSWGIVNLDEVEHRYRVYPTSLFNNRQDDFFVTVPAFSMTQQALPRDVDFGPDGMMVVIDMNDDFEDFVPPWVAFASSTDNETGDGWVVLSSADWDDEDF
jgi:hypothetical protein